MIPIDLSGKRGLVMGVSNARSIGWAIADKLHAAGAELAFSYQGERLREDLEKLTAGMPGVQLFDCDVTRDEQLAATFNSLREAWGTLDYVVHSIAFAPRPAMDGRFIDTTRQDWATALDISAYSLVAVARHAEPLLSADGALVTLTYYASEKVVPKYNVMAIAKSALEASEKLFDLAGSSATRAAHALDRHWRNARVHTLHDPVRWKYHLLGNYYLNGAYPARHQWN